MPSLAKVADVLVRYANSVTTGTVPQVQFNFQHDPSDLEQLDGDSWKLQVVLQGFDQIGEPPTFVKTWTTLGRDETECLDKVAVQLAETMTLDLAVKQAESEAVAGALRQLQLDGELPAIWPQTKDQAENAEIAEETRDELGGHDWSAPPQP